MADRQTAAKASRGRRTVARSDAGNGTTRAEARAVRVRAAQVRRARVFLAGSVLVSALVLGAWFPAGALLHQHQAIAAAKSQLTQLRQEDQALAQEQRRLNSPAEVNRIARQQYQLVSPGQRAYQVLPPSSTGGSASYAGDPAFQPLVSPSSASVLPPASATSGAGNGSGPSSVGPTSAKSASGRSQGRVGSTAPQSPGFFGRIAQTLEFWR